MNTFQNLSAKFITKNLAFCLLSMSMFCVNSVKAEYNGHFIDFNIELKNGEVIEAHSYLSSLAYMVDSGSYENYLESRMDLLLRDDFSMDDDVFAYHEYRLTYKFQYPDFDSGMIFTLASKKAISMDEVKGLEITEMIDFTYATIVVNSLSKNDEKWMNTPPVGFYNTGDKFNAFDVFIHEKNIEIDQILLELDKESHRYEEKLKSLEFDYKYADSAERQEIEEQIDKLEEERMQEVQDGLGRLFPFKLVIIGYLSC